MRISNGMCNTYSEKGEQEGEDRKEGMVYTLSLYMTVFFRPVLTCSYVVILAY